MAQYEQVQEIMANYTDRINDAKDLATIRKEKDAAVAALQKIKTNEQLNSEESSRTSSTPESSADESSADESSADESSDDGEEQRRILRAYRAEAVTELQYYLDEDDYDSEQREVIRRVISTYMNHINNANSYDAIWEQVANAKRVLDEIPTIYDAPEPSEDSSKPSYEPQSSVEDSSEPKSSSEDSSEPESSDEDNSTPDDSGENSENTVPSGDTGN